MWKQLNINDCLYFIKLNITSEVLTATFTDLEFIWKESLDVSGAVSRFKVCNTGVKAPDESILSFIKSLIEEEKIEMALQIRDTVTQLDMAKVLGHKMKFYFMFSKQNEESVFQEITLPLLLLVGEFKHREDLLYKQLEAKDVELLEFKLEGFKITRKNVITSKFQKEDFNKSVKDDIEQRLRANISLAHDAFVEDMNEVYPLYEKCLLPYGTQQLKRGHIVDEKKDEEVKEEKKILPKRRYGNELNVPIKRVKHSKKRIL